MWVIIQKKYSLSTPFTLTYISLVPSPIPKSARPYANLLDTYLLTSESAGMESSLPSSSDMQEP